MMDFKQCMDEKKELSKELKVGDEAFIWIGYNEGKIVRILEDDNTHFIFEDFYEGKWVINRERKEYFNPIK